MKVLITGGAGFIGSHVAEELLRHEHKLAIIDNLNEYYSPHSKLENLSAIRAVAPIAFHACDVRNTDEISRIMQEDRPEAVIHLAACVGLRPSLIDPHFYESVNVGGTLALLEACRRFRIRKFVFASSNSVYGLCTRIPFQEDDRPNWPLSPYAATKIAGEKLCHVYSHLYGISAVCLRLFTVYGPRQRPDMAIRRFTEMIDDGLAIPVFGDGTHERDYTYIDDAVQGLLKALDLDCGFEVFNLGSSEKISLRRLITQIEKQLGKTAVIDWQPEQPGDMPLTLADITKARKILGYQPSTALEDGIRKFVRWFQVRKAGHTSVGNTSGR